MGLELQNFTRIRKHCFKNWKFVRDNNSIPVYLMKTRKNKDYTNRIKILPTLAKAMEYRYILERIKVVIY